jgi:nucleoside-diphosphate-sugar epimerase
VRVLLTGSGGVLGSEVTARLRGHPGVALVTATRTPVNSRDVRWLVGAEPPPDVLAGHWDVIVHAAASTRWTMTREEATLANVDPTLAVLDLAGPDTHLVHVSTAYVEGDGVRADPSTAFGQNRNGYEWSKAKCEDLVRGRHPGPLTVVRPPLILGGRPDGVISRFTGPYTMFRALISGLAPAVVGEPGCYVEIAPVDEVAGVIVAAVLGPPPTRQTTAVVTAGKDCLTLGEFLAEFTTTVNGLRAARNLPPVALPPFVPQRRWERLYLPMATRHLSEVQRYAVELLAMFQHYTSMRSPIAPTHPVRDPAQVLARSLGYWARQRPRLIDQIPQAWHAPSGA